eukprot:7720111-Pyramimonas_sp.AAC.1
MKNKQLQPATEKNKGKDRESRKKKSEGKDIAEDAVSHGRVRPTKSAAVGKSATYVNNDDDE